MDEPTKSKWSGTISDVVARFDLPDPGQAWASILGGRVLINPQGKRVVLEANSDDKQGDLWIVKEHDAIPLP